MIKDEFNPQSAIDVAIDIIEPEHQSVPVIFTSPHSGRDYPADFLAQSRLDPLTLRSSEDAFVEELFAGVTGLGAPLLSARFPRVYVDVNRQPLELDPAMFEGALPDRIDSNTLRVRAGIGTIARVVNNDQEIYNTKLLYRDIQTRLENCYFPYHQALQNLIDQTMDRFGACLIVDCHSMPSPSRASMKKHQAEIVLGDRWGAACDHQIIQAAERAVLDLGYSVRCNTPYAGGYTTQHYGRPETGVQAIQIEIDRSLYMDEQSIRKRPNFEHLQQSMTHLGEALCRTASNLLTERLAAQ